MSYGRGRITLLVTSTLAAILFSTISTVGEWAICGHPKCPYFNYEDRAALLWLA